MATPEHEHGERTEERISMSELLRSCVAATAISTPPRSLADATPDDRASGGGGAAAEPATGRDGTCGGDGGTGGGTTQVREGRQGGQDRRGREAA